MLFKHARRSRDSPTCTPIHVGSHEWIAPRYSPGIVLGQSIRRLAPNARVFELEVAMLYVSRYPRLITAFTVGLSAKKRRDIPLPSMQKILFEVRDEIEAGAEAYRELCDMAHTGSLATWSAFNVMRDGEDTLNLSWSSQPRFREGQALIAAAQLKQLSESTIYIFHELLRQFLA